MYTFHNPVAPKASDPWLIRDGEGYYYCYSGGGSVNVMKLDRLDGVPKGEPVRVWAGPPDTLYSHEYWAPELHRIDGKWYIYVAADDGSNENHRMYVLGCDEPQGQYRLLGKLADLTDKWAIDGTVFEWENRLYFVWSGWEGDVNIAQNLYIAPLLSPWTVGGERVCLSKPEYEWECRGGEPRINEGPAALVRNGDVHLVYSASGSWSDDYCLGMLTFCGGDILNPENWEKSAEPVFSKAPDAYGPGHCSFTASKDGKQDFIVYHANIVPGSGWGGRTMRIQPFTWQNGKPFFGQPLPLGETVAVED